MPDDITLLAAFLTGLLGSVHCIGMCGGIVGSLSMGISPIKKNTSKTLLFILLYNLGRLSSYIIAGAIVAGIGKTATDVFNQDAQQLGGQLSAVFMVLLGLYVAGWWQFLRILETAGSYLWKRIQPFGNKLLPVKTYPHAFMLGTLWGWLPCGMVYAMLVFALSSQDVLQGGLIMLAFGLGTLPTLVLMGTAAHRFKTFIHQPVVRQLAGSLIILFGLYSLFGPNPHAHHNHNHMQHSQLSYESLLYPLISGNPQKAFPWSHFPALHT